MVTIGLDGVEAGKKEKRYKGYKVKEKAVDMLSLFCAIT